MPTMDEAPPTASCGEFATGPSGLMDAGVVDLGEHLIAAHARFEHGHTPEDVDVVLEPLVRASGLGLVVLWDYVDAIGAGGNSQLFAARERDDLIEVHEVSAMLHEHLYEPVGVSALLPALMAQAGTPGLTWANVHDLLLHEHPLPAFGSPPARAGTPNARGRHRCWVPLKVSPGAAGQVPAAHRISRHNIAQTHSRLCL